VAAVVEHNACAGKSLASTIAHRATHQTAEQGVDVKGDLGKLSAQIGRGGRAGGIEYVRVAESHSGTVDGIRLSVKLIAHTVVAVIHGALHQQHDIGPRADQERGVQRDGDEVLAIRIGHIAVKDLGQLVRCYPALAEVALGGVAQPDAGGFIVDVGAGEVVVKVDPGDKSTAALEL